METFEDIAAKSLVNCHAFGVDSIMLNDKPGKTLGYFSSEISAAECYDTAARLHFKEYARLNFP